MGRAALAGSAVELDRWVKSALSALAVLPFTVGHFGARCGLQVLSALAGKRLIDAGNLIFIRRLTRFGDFGKQ